MAKQTRPRPVCCPKPFVIREILLFGGEETEVTYYELREDGGYELEEDGFNELREY